MDYTEIIKKLIGPIRPVGKTEIDEMRLKNLMDMCEVANNLIAEIDAVSYDFKDCHEHSIKEAQIYAETFLSNRIGIVK